MATHEAKLGLGMSTGMFFHAPAGTALPTTPGEELAAAWTEVGDITEDGITLSLSRDVTTLKNWAKRVKRVIQTDHTETIQAPIQDTTEEVFKILVGEDNVTKTAATSSHGEILTVDLSEDFLPDEEAFLFLMKDDDDLIAIGMTRGQIQAVADINFAPSNTITWTPTITAIEGFKLITDDGQTT